MAVTVAGTPTQSNGVGVSSLTFSFTATGCDGLFVGSANQDPQAYTSITYNGVSMTELWDKQDDIVIDRCCGYLMIAPASGANNVVITPATTCDVIWGGAVGLTGLEQASVAAAHRTVYTADETAGGGPSVTVVDSQNGDLVIDCVGTFNTTIAAGTGQTSRVEDDSVAATTFSTGISTESATGASTVMSWTGGSFWCIGATALIAASGGGGGSSRQSLMMMGCGR